MMRFGTGYVIELTMAEDGVVKGLPLYVLQHAHKGAWTPKVEYTYGTVTSIEDATMFGGEAYRIVEHVQARMAEYHKGITATVVSVMWQRTVQRAAIENETE